MRLMTTGIFITMYLSRESGRAFQKPKKVKFGLSILGNDKLGVNLNLGPIAPTRLVFVVPRTPKDATNMTRFF